MNKRRRGAVLLDSTDEAYFRLGAKAGVKPTPKPVSKPQTPAEAPIKAKRAKATPKPAIATTTAPQTPPEAAKARFVNYNVAIGRKTSAALYDVAERAGVSEDAILKGARTRTVKAFRALLKGSAKPKVPELIKGGESIRIQIPISATEAAQIDAWFDPLGIGIARESLAPVLAAMLQAEVARICDNAPG